MQQFSAHRMCVRAQVITPVSLNEHKGSAIRGALFHSLRNRFCTLRDRRSCSDCPLWEGCPVCSLVSTIAPDNRLGHNAARPYTVQPPLEETRLFYRPGDTLSFGLTLFSDALRLFPYLTMALQGMAEQGLGRKCAENGWRRGTFELHNVWAENPLSNQREPILQKGHPSVHTPDIPITHQQILAQAERMAQASDLTLELLTPTRLTHRKRLVKPGSVTFRIVLARLLDRLQSLAASQCDTPLELDYGQLVRSAENVKTVADRTRWVELASYSTRQRRTTPIGGLVGAITFCAHDWRPYLPWLLWGQYTHIGKDAVKGNGWYRLTPTA